MSSNASSERQKTPSADSTKHGRRGRRKGSSTCHERPIFKPVKSDDPVLGFIYTATQEYGYDTTDVKDLAVKRDSIIQEIRERTSTQVRRLFPNMSYTDLARWLNVPVYIASTAACPNLVRKRKTVDPSRLTLLNLLVHIAGIRDTLIDIEREIWVTLQLCQDPRLLLDYPPEPKGDGYGKGERKKRLAESLRRRRELKKRAEAGLPIPPKSRPPMILPFRALKALGLPQSHEIPTTEGDKRLREAARERRRQAKLADVSERAKQEARERMAKARRARLEQMEKERETKLANRKHMPFGYKRRT